MTTGYAFQKHLYSNRRNGTIIYITANGEAWFANKETVKWISLRILRENPEIVLTRLESAGIKLNSTDIDEALASLSP